MRRLANRLVPHGVVNLELVQHSYCQQTLAEQNLMGLGAEVELPLCDFKDVTLVMHRRQRQLDSE